MESSVVVWQWAEHNQGLLTVIGIVVTIILGLFIKSAITNSQTIGNNGVNVNGSTLKKVNNKGK